MNVASNGSRGNVMWSGRKIIQGMENTGKEIQYVSIKSQHLVEDK